jgi:hypothetical protein
MPPETMFLEFLRKPPEAEGHEITIGDKNKKLESFALLGISGLGISRREISSPVMSSPLISRREISGREILGLGGGGHILKVICIAYMHSMV